MAKVMKAGEGIVEEKLGADIMSPQALLHELGRLSRAYEIFKSGEAVIQGLLRAEARKKVLEGEIVDLTEKINSKTLDYNRLRADAETLAGQIESTQATAVGDTAKACEAEKEKHRGEIQILKDEIGVLKGDRSQAEADFAQFKEEQGVFLKESKAEADREEVRLQTAREELAKLKDKL